MVVKYLSSEKCFVSQAVVKTLRLLLISLIGMYCLCSLFDGSGEYKKNLKQFSESGERMKGRNRFVNAIN